MPGGRREWPGCLSRVVSVVRAAEVGARALVVRGGENKVVNPRPWQRRRGHLEEGGSERASALVPKRVGDTGRASEDRGHGWSATEAAQRREQRVAQGARLRFLLGIRHNGGVPSPYNQAGGSITVQSGGG